MNESFKKDNNPAEKDPEIILRTAAGEIFSRESKRSRTIIVNNDKLREWHEKYQNLTGQAISEDDFHDKAGLVFEKL